MGAKCVRPRSPDITGHPAFVPANNDNVLGAVCEASLSYIALRRMHNPEDVVSMVKFNHRAETVFGHLPVTTLNAALVGYMLTMAPDGGTDFGLALDHAAGLLATRRRIEASTEPSQKRHPVFILLTDSMDNSSLTAVMLDMIMSREPAAEDGGLTVHVLGFGSEVNEDYIRRLASIGRGTYKVCREVADVGRLALVSAFNVLAEEPGKTFSLMPVTQ